MIVESAHRPIEILLVEDNPGDVRLMREALRESKVHHTMTVVDDGEEAMAYLRHIGKYLDASRPQIIFLDLNLPRKDGREVLQEIKQDADLRRIPVVIMTTSSSERDIVNAYQLHANCYITKPVDLDDFLVSVRTCENFWLETAQLPFS